MGCYQYPFFSYTRLFDHYAAYTPYMHSVTTPQQATAYANAHPCATTRCRKKEKNIGAVPPLAGPGRAPPYRGPAVFYETTSKGRSRAARARAGRLRAKNT